MSSLLGYGDSVILGFVEGLTEFLPVSSTGHLTIAEKLLGLPVNDTNITAYTAIIQFGATIATFLYFRQDIWRLARAWARGLFSAEERTHRDYRFAWYVIAGSAPIILAALAFKPLIEGGLRSLWVVAVALILWSAVIYIAERRGTGKLAQDDLSLRHVLIIGLVQSVALIPGISRSGATISTGLMLGVDRLTATRLSFFLAIPALTGATAYELKDLNTSVIGWGPLGVGVLVSFLVAYVSIAWLLRLVAKHPLTVFVPYRLALGALLLLALGAGWMSAT